MLVLIGVNSTSFALRLTLVFPDFVGVSLRLPASPRVSQRPEMNVPIAIGVIRDDLSDI